MKMLKKIMLVILTLVLVVYISGCSNNSNNLSKVPENNSINSTQENQENTLDSKKFLDTVSNIHNSLNDMIGQEVEITGFVYIDKELDDNKFVLGRNYIHTYDNTKQFSGIICEYDKVSELKNNEWIKINGIVNSMPHPRDKNSVVPRIIIKKIIKVNPESSNVYYE